MFSHQIARLAFPATASGSINENSSLFLESNEDKIGPIHAIGPRVERAKRKEKRIKGKKGRKKARELP